MPLTDIYFDWAYNFPKEGFAGLPARTAVTFPCPGDERQGVVEPSLEKSLRADCSATERFRLHIVRDLENQSIRNECKPARLPCALRSKRTGVTLLCRNPRTEHAWAAHLEILPMVDSCHNKSGFTYRYVFNPLIREIDAATAFTSS